MLIGKPAMTESIVPDRCPLACGALGAYEPERVAAVAAALAPEMATVHRDAISVLVLDRSP